MGLCNAHANQASQQAIDIFPERLIQTERCRVERLESPP